MSDFEAMVDELYLLPPSQFVEVRTELVATVRTAGDPATAAAIAKLRKPTVGAWLLNVLAAEAPDLLAGAIAIGPALREATAARDGSAIRDLSTHRRTLLGEVVQQARATAEEHGQAFTPALEREIEASVTAAMTDDSAAAALTSRRLTAPIALEDHGFGAASEGASAPAPRRPAATKAGSAREQTAEQLAELAAQEERRRAVEAAEQDLAAARLQAADAENALEAAEATVVDAEAAEREAADALRAAKAALSDARADRTAAKADAASAQKAVDVALAALERLRRT